MLDRLRVICVFGDDADLVHHAARLVVAAAAGSADDPFLVSLTADANPATVDAALTSPPLAGGRSVVWARDATDRLHAIVTHVLGGSTTSLLVIECGAPSRTIKLRRVVAASERGCALACYGSDEAMHADIRALLRDDGVSIDDDTLARLAGWAVSTEQSARQVAELARLYIGAAGTADARDATALVDTVVAGHPVGLFAAVGRALSGDRRGLPMAIETALADGTAVGAARVALAAVQRLRASAIPAPDARRRNASPYSAHESADADAVLRRHTAEQLSSLACSLWRTEGECKRTGMPAELVVRAALLRVD